MKVTVRNLGVIKEEANFELKPLTIFIGPNNAGKTWLAYVLAAILGQYGLEEYKQAYFSGKAPAAFSVLNEAIQRFADEGNAKIDLAQFADEHAETYFNNVASLVAQWMPDFMGTEWASFQNLQVRLGLAETKTHFLEAVLGGSIERKLSEGLAGQAALLTAFKESGKRELYFYTSGSVSEKLPSKAVKEFLVGTVFESLHEFLYLQTYTFPAERTTFITFTPLNTNRSLGQKKFITRGIGQQEQRARSLVTPVSDFLDMIMILFESSLSRRKKAAKNHMAIAQYMQLAQILERHILGGEVDFSTPEPDPRRKILFKPNEHTSLEISVVSSMVKEFAPLVLYLRYLARPGELLVIDEPEMNLHPAAQVKLIEFLAMLVDAGLHLLITTHSTYVIDHLVNLMDAHKHEDQEEIIEKFLLEEKKAFVSQEKVSVYLVENGKVTNVLNAEGRIDWSTFSAVTDQVESISFEM